MKSSKDRAKGSIMGTLIGDALGVGPHWYYDLDQMRKDYGEWIDDYASPKPDRFHSGLKAGENSQTGQVATLLLESVSERGEYRESDFTDRLDVLLETLDGTPQAGRYTDQAMREVWKARQEEGLDWSEAGSYADTAEAAIRTPVLAARYHGDIKNLMETLRSNILLTHREPFIAGQSTAFGLIVSGLIDGHPMDEIPKAVRGRISEAGLRTAVEVRVGGQKKVVSFVDALLQPAWSYAATREPGVAIEPAFKACRLFGLACTLGFMLPAAYYFASRFEDDFYKAVMSALNGGGNNMARTALTGALAGAQVGLSGIPDYLIEGLSNHGRLLEMAEEVAAGV